MTEQRTTRRRPDSPAAPAQRLARSEAAGCDAPQEGLLALDRRRFLEASGFGLFLSALAGCSRAPVRHILSPAAGEEGAAAGLARHYASTCGGCPAACGVVVKTRDGRPIKLEGNPDHCLSQGGLCAVGQAEVLGLYDSQRLRQPQIDGRPADWPQVDQRLERELAAAGRDQRSVYLLSNTIHGPTTRAAIERFLAANPGTRHVVYDPLSASAIRAAHRQTHGRSVLPRYRFDRADVIVGLGADFLGTWIAPVEYTAGYRTRRAPQGQPARMSYHLQIESRMSLTGSNADQRWVVASDELPAIAGRLATEVAALAERTAADGPAAENRAAAEKTAARDAASGVLAAAGSSVSDQQIKTLADRLWQARGQALLVCDSQHVPTQVACNFINHTLGSYGQTVDLAAESQQRGGEAAPLDELLTNLEAGRVGVLLITGVNPIYDLPLGGRLAELLRGASAPFVLRLGQHADETAAVATCVCPESHWLESWGDAEPVKGVLSLVQPAIAPLGSTRSLLECLLAWTPTESAPGSAEMPPAAATGDAAADPAIASAADSADSGPPESGLADPIAEVSAAYTAIRRHWEHYVFPQRADQQLDAAGFWEDALRRGTIQLPKPNEQPMDFDRDAVRLSDLPPAAEGDSISLVLYPKVGMLEGRAAHNPWLHELPDPVSKVAWDNYACLSPHAAQRLGVRQGDVVRVTAGGNSLELPVLIQVGQHDRVVAVALGYGRQGTGRFAEVGPQWLEARPTVGPSGLVGVNAAPLLRWEAGTFRYERSDIRIQAAGGWRALATTQQHHSLSVPSELATPGTEHRPIVEETTLAAYREDPHAGATVHHHFPGQLWEDDHPYTGHRWGMVIDLNRCTGCSACVIACQAENNVPVVGRDEVLRSREMHWIRIDRYYDEAEPGVSSVHQPMLCQHCAHAPCENVCPVLATVHSQEGLNQQVYNRCVGTRYCANNCPYKVRRFNWFEYSREERLENAALNPDVTVRSRGVMEKCSFCVQRVQEATLLARQRGEAVADGAVQTACQQSCPAAAIQFGDLNDPQSGVAQAAAAGRHFRVLSELNVRPSVGYLRVVRNRQEQSQETHHV